MLSIKYLSIFIILGGAAAWGEVIANKKIVDKKFNVWNVSCEEDEMLGKIRCIMFVEITNKTTILVNPHNNHKILLISKDGYSGKNFSMKVDNGKLIVSKPLSDEKYGIVNFSDEDLKNLFEQIKSGSNLYMRFAIGDSVLPDGFREITIKFSLMEFQKAFIYYNEQLNKYRIPTGNHFLS